MGDPNTACPRQTFFVRMSEEAPEVANYAAEMAVKLLFVWPIKYDTGGLSLL